MYQSVSDFIERACKDELDMLKVGKAIFGEVSNSKVALKAQHPPFIALSKATPP